MPLLTKAQILGAEDLEHRDVAVPEWGGTVRVRCMTGEERDAYETSLYNGEKVNLDNVRARLLVLTLIDETGNRLFAEVADIAALGKKSVRAMQRVFEVAKELNALDTETLKELAKNSATGPGAGSPSA